MHAMRDVENGDVLRLEARQHGVDLLDIGAGEGGGRFVQHEKLRPLAEGLGDLDHLAARKRQIPHAHQRIDVFAADLGEKLLGAAALRLRIDDAEAARRRCDRDIVRDREVRQKRQFLKDRGDAGRIGGGGRKKADFLSVEPHGAGIRLHDTRDDLDQGRFARAVLAEHRVDLAPRTGEIDVLERGDAAVTLGNAQEGEKIPLARCLHRAALFDHGI